MADAAQIRKVCAIIRADEARKIIVVSAAGKRSKDDHKITDLLYLCYAHIKYGVSCMDVFEQVKQRYLDIRDELGLNTPLETEFDALWERMQHGIGEDELVSRGEYFSARLLADALGYDFIDAKLWLTFALDGSIDEEASYSALRRIAANRRAVIPGFYGIAPGGRILTLTRGGSDVTGALAAYFGGEMLGRSVYRAALGNVIYGTGLVENYRLSAPASDIAGAADRLPVLGTLRLTEAAV